MTKAITMVVLLIVLLVPEFGRAEGNCEPLPKGGGEPGKALMSFLEAAHKRDFEQQRGQSSTDLHNVEIGSNLVWHEVSV